jgi:hypothetical protein
MVSTGSQTHSSSNNQRVGSGNGRIDKDRTKRDINGHQHIHHPRENPQAIHNHHPLVSRPRRFDLQHSASSVITHTVYDGAAYPIEYFLHG